MLQITKNEEKNGIELKFDGKPEAEVLTALKQNGFRWHRAKKIWYAKETPERIKLAESFIVDKAVNDTVEKHLKDAEKPKTNKFGVKVGDLFEASWGYDQTNVDFFQVIKLVGEKSVRVRAVDPPMIDEKGIGPMSADRTYKVTNELLPPSSVSVFIKDQENGDLKRLKSYAADGVSNPCFSISSFADADLVTEDKITVYESWYA